MVRPFVHTHLSEMSSTSAKQLARNCLLEGIDAARPRNVVSNSLSVADEVLRIGDNQIGLEKYDEIIVLGGGNAAAHVAAELETILQDRISEGLVITDDPVSTDHVTVRRGDHPIPSKRATDATRELLEYADAADENTLVLTIITGGGSALLPAPASGLTLDDIQNTTNELLRSGASINELNAVRKHLSDIKGGQLAQRLLPARVVTLILSDVVGNDLSVIASGPTVPDQTTCEDAREVIDRYELNVPSSVNERLKATNIEAVETPAPGDPAFNDVSTHILATNRTALDAASSFAEQAGYRTVLLSSQIHGEAREAAKTHTAITKEILESGNPVEQPVVILSGGECTVTVRGEGTGGPNLEFALQSALELPENVVVASIDSDGIDGSTDAAGALVDGNTVEDPRLARDILNRNDAYTYLKERDTLLEFGPTGTNVNDIRIIVIE